MKVDWWNVIFWFLLGTAVIFVAGYFAGCNRMATRRIERDLDQSKDLEVGGLTDSHMCYISVADRMNGIPPTSRHGTRNGQVYSAQQVYRTGDVRSPEQHDGHHVQERVSQEVSVLLSEHFRDVQTISDTRCLLQPRYTWTLNQRSHSGTYDRPGCQNTTQAAQTAQDA